VLFSEPKIPQYKRVEPDREQRERFSALQRAENSSMPLVDAGRSQSRRFSALQRAENSSM